MPDDVDGYGITCQPTDAAVSAGVPIMVASPDEPGAVQLSLLAPDDALVTAKYNDGTSTVLKPRSDGMIAATLRGGPTVQVITPLGTRSFAVPKGHTALIPK